MMIAEGFTCQRYGFNVGADKFSLLTIENGKTSIMRLSEWTLISQSQKSHSDRLLEKRIEHVTTLLEQFLKHLPAPEQERTTFSNTETAKLPR